MLRKEEKGGFALHNESRCHSYALLNTHMPSGGTPQAKWRPPEVKWRHLEAKWRHPEAKWRPPPKAK
jgi:hypothetical protein